MIRCNVRWYDMIWYGIIIIIIITAIIDITFLIELCYIFSIICIIYKTFCITSIAIIDSVWTVIFLIYILYYLFYFFFILFFILFFIYFEIQTCSVPSLSAALHDRKQNIKNGINYEIDEGISSAIKVVQEKGEKEVEVEVEVEGADDIFYYEVCGK